MFSSVHSLFAGQVGPSSVVTLPSFITEVPVSNFGSYTALDSFFVKNGVFWNVTPYSSYKKRRFSASSIKVTRIG
jgi:hypothetical protein